MATTDYGLKVSRPGYSIESTDERELAFTSERNVLKVKVQGATTVNGVSSTSIAHGLAYLPAFVVYGEITAGSDIFYAANPAEWYAEVDTTNLVITVSSGAGIKDFYYYIFIDAGS